MDPSFSVLNDRAVLTLTKRGEQALLEPGTTLAPSQLEALVLIGGSSTVSTILKRAKQHAPRCPAD